MANNSLIIKTPPSEITRVSSPSGGVTANIKWNSSFGSERTAQFLKAQKFIDSEVLRHCTPYVPMDTTALIKSGILGTVIGSGEVNYITPYAARLYYNPQYNFNEAPQRGAFWFERMKIDHGSEILQGAKTPTGGK
ncbi:MAG: hypothetical protein RR576_01390 [Oscillospiraceae bacterium]